MIDLLNEQEVMPPPEAHIRIKVTNRNGFVMRDRFDGVPFTFKPNEPVILTQAQAQHFFGYPGTQEDRALYMAKRFGWSSAEYVVTDPLAGPEALSLYKKYANNIILDIEEFELVPKSKAALADDGLDIETMPTADGPSDPASGAKPAGGVGTAVGKRKGSPVKLGGTRRSRKQAANTDPGFTPLG